jgi:hypothetical protein
VLVALWIAVKAIGQACCGVFAHGAPETPVLVFGGKDRAHLFVSVIGGEIPCA